MYLGIKSTSKLYILHVLYVKTIYSGLTGFSDESLFYLSDYSLNIEIN